MLKEFREERLIWNRFHKTAEKQLLPLFRKAIMQSIQPVMTYAELEGTDNIPVEQLINSNVWQSVYQRAYEITGMKMAKSEYYRQRKNEPTATKASAIDFLVDVWSGKLKDYALQYVYQIQRELNDTTVEMIRRALGDVADLDMDREGRVRLFLKGLGQRAKMRAGTISRTETSRIANLGKNIAAVSWIETQGGQSYKVWLGRNDKNERRAHLEENDTIIEMENTFDLDGHLCQRPGDFSLPANQVINCRCTCSFMSINRYNRYQKLGRIVNGKLVGAS